MGVADSLLPVFFEALHFAQARPKACSLRLSIYARPRLAEEPCGWPSQGSSANKKRAQQLHFLQIFLGCLYSLGLVLHEDLCWHSSTIIP